MENKRVVFINGDTSSWFEQAIIIVKDSRMKDGFEAGRPTPSLVEQAERIVNGYNPFKAYQSFAPKAANVCQTERAANAKPSKKPAKSSFDTYLNLIMLVSCVVLAGILITQL